MFYVLNSGPVPFDPCSANSGKQGRDLVPVSQVCNTVFRDQFALLEQNANGKVDVRDPYKGKSWKGTG